MFVLLDRKGEGGFSTLKGEVFSKSLSTRRKT